MSLTEKDKKEIATIVTKIVDERLKSAETMVVEPANEPVTNDVYDFDEMFSDWDDSSILLSCNDIKQITSEDFVLPCDYQLKDGTVLKKGKRYFTFDEAKALEEQLFKPNGWELPTVKDFMILHATYGLDKNGRDDPKALHKALNLDCNGFISSSNMEKYNKDPENFEKNGGTVSNRTTNGHWWSSYASSSTYGYYLVTASGYVNSQSSDYRGYGFSIRCVAR